MGWLETVGDLSVGIRTSFVASNEELTTDQRDLDMVDPDLVGAVQGNSITAPDELGVQLGDVNVLDNDIANAVAHAQTLATDDTSTANTNDGLVGGHIDTLNRSLVVSAGQAGIITTPVRRVQINGVLTRAAAGVGLGLAAVAVRALAAEIVELLVDQNGTGSAVCQPLGELGGIAGRCRACISTTSGASCEAKCLARDASGLGSGSQQRKGCEERFLN